VNSRKKILLWCSILFASHALIFVGGAITGRLLTVNYIADQGGVAEARVMLGNYTTYRNIALAVRAGDDETALCYAELNASLMYDSLSACVANGLCGGDIEKGIRKIAPEILGDAPLTFKYIKNSAGGRRCD
jgi:hypothetical protein